MDAEAERAVSVKEENEPWKKQKTYHISRYERTGGKTVLEHINFEYQLPEKYTEIFSVDATDKKTAVILNLAAGVLMFLTGFIGYRWLMPVHFMRETPLWKELLFLAALFLYIVLHELTHGAAYKLLTRQKLTYGFTLSVAYCGVPHIYVYRRTAIISLLAPFVTFTILFAILTLMLQDVYSKYLAWLLLSMHIGGCAGDLYDTLLYLFKLRNPETLMKDTGPKQTFYLPEKLQIEAGPESS